MYPKTNFILGWAPISPKNEVHLCVNFALITWYHEVDLQVCVRVRVHKDGDSRTRTRTSQKKSSSCTCMCDCKDRPKYFYVVVHFFRIECNWTTTNCSSVCTKSICYGYNFFDSVMYLTCYLPYNPHYKNGQMSKWYLKCSYNVRRVSVRNTGGVKSICYFILFFTSYYDTIAIGPICLPTIFETVQAPHQLPTF